MVTAIAGHTQHIYIAVADSQDSIADLSIEDYFLSSGGGWLSLSDLPDAPSAILDLILPEAVINIVISDEALASAAAIEDLSVSARAGNPTVTGDIEVLGVIAAIDLAVAVRAGDPAAVLNATAVAPPQVIIGGVLYVADSTGDELFKIDHTDPGTNHWRIRAGWRVPDWAVLPQWHGGHWWRAIRCRRHW